MSTTMMLNGVEEDGYSLGASAGFVTDSLSSD